MPTTARSHAVPPHPRGGDPVGAVPAAPTEEAVHDRARLRQWLDGRARADGVDRRHLLKLVAAASAVSPFALVAGPSGAVAASPAASPASADPAPGIVKPLPPQWFTVRGTNAETNFEALRGTGLTTPVDRFFVRNHTATPRIDVDQWRLRIWGSGLEGSEVRFTYEELTSMPAVTRTAFVECAGNGRSYFDSQQHQEVSGTAWTFGAIGTAHWRGVRLAEVLRRAGIAPGAVDVMPRGLDDEVVTDGVNLGRVRRPLPVAKALDDVVLAYEMNGRPLPPDHGFPVRVLVPSWVGVSSVKWVGDIEVSAEPLYSPWNTDMYRLFGPDHPEGGSAPLTRQTLKSAFELRDGAELTARRRQLLTGRSWSGGAPVRAVEISTDGGGSWRPARLHDTPRRGSWVRWSAPWTPRDTGPVELLARATDASGATQPDRTVHNTQGYLFGAVVRHPVTVV